MKRAVSRVGSNWRRSLGGLGLWLACAAPLLASIPRANSSQQWAAVGAPVSCASVRVFAAHDSVVSVRSDHRDRVTNVTTTVSNLTWNVGYRYDGSGNVTNLVYPGNRVVRYVYDAENRVTAVTDWNNRTIRFGYDARGRLTALTNDATGVTSSFSYDLENRVTGYQHRNAGGAFAARTLWRNAVGYKTQEDLNAGLTPLLPPVLASSAKAISYQ
jgi:YD repeat-containing protein